MPGGEWLTETRRSASELKLAVMAIVLLALCVSGVIASKSETSSQSSSQVFSSGSSDIRGALENQVGNSTTPIDVDPETVTGDVGARESVQGKLLVPGIAIVVCVNVILYVGSVLVRAKKALEDSDSSDRPEDPPPPDPD